MALTLLASRMLPVASQFLGVVAIYGQHTDASSTSLFRYLALHQIWSGIAMGHAAFRVSPGSQPVYHEVTPVGSYLEQLSVDVLRKNQIIFESNQAVLRDCDWIDEFICHSG